LLFTGSFDLARGLLRARDSVHLLCVKKGGCFGSMHKHILVWQQGSRPRLAAKRVVGYNTFFVS
jgi:hypothetical protein